MLKEGMQDILNTNEKITVMRIYILNLFFIIEPSLY